VRAGSLSNSSTFWVCHPGVTCVLEELLGGGGRMQEQISECAGTAVRKNVPDGLRLECERAEADERSRGSP